MYQFNQKNTKRKAQYNILSKNTILKMITKRLKEISLSDFNT